MEHNDFLNSEGIGHECGLALIRLLKPLDYYKEKYGTALFGLAKLSLLMEKQRNRGQDGAGAACIKIDHKIGAPFIFRKRSNSDHALQQVFQEINQQVKDAKEKSPQNYENTQWLKENIDFAGELLLGHLRYGTYGKNTISFCHPFLRQSNWKSRNLVVAGNFNLTNVEEIFGQLVDWGQNPREKADTVLVMDLLRYFLDEENDRLWAKLKTEKLSPSEISEKVGESIDISTILTKATEKWDGGYVIAGLMGHGDAFVFRDKQGIRPAFYYQSDEVIVVASERPAIMTTFKITESQVNELKPGHAISIKRSGQVSVFPYGKIGVVKECSFERIYFSRGNDPEIYKERKQLGRNLTPKILQMINSDLENTVFSFIPNTAEVCFMGLIEGLETYLNDWKKQQVLKLISEGKTSEKDLSPIFAKTVRVDKIALKDAKMRTFIAADEQRKEMVSHVYDVTYGALKPSDTLVIVDDSIVRGTTLKDSIIRMLDTLNPKRIIFVSSAPQIRYPDCYGIDMTKLGEFVAFRAAIELLNEKGKKDAIEAAYQQAKKVNDFPLEKIPNCVKAIYDPLTADEVSEKIAKLCTEADIQSKVEVVYQTIEGLHQSCPKTTGDWYFTGNYPTPGGNKVANQSFMLYIEGKNSRAY